MDFSNDNLRHVVRWVNAFVLQCHKFSGLFFTTSPTLVYTYSKYPKFYGNPLTWWQKFQVWRSSKIVMRVRSFDYVGRRETSESSDCDGETGLQLLYAWSRVSWCVLEYSHLFSALTLTDPHQRGISVCFEPSYFHHWQPPFVQLQTYVLIHIGSAWISIVLFILPL